MNSQERRPQRGPHRLRTLVVLATIVFAAVILWLQPDPTKTELANEDLSILPTRRSVKKTRTAPSSETGGGGDITFLNNNNNNNDNTIHDDSGAPKTKVSDPSGGKFSPSVYPFDAILSRFYNRHEIEQGKIGHFFFEKEIIINDKHKNLADVISESNGVLLPLNKQQYDLLAQDDDVVVDPATEKARCQRYGLDYEEGRTKRRRIFYGSTIADDSFFTLQTISTETYNLFHTVAFVESNTTHTRTNRTMRFPPSSPYKNDDDAASKHNNNNNNNNHKALLKSMFGPKTRVSVDYFVDSFQLESTESIYMFQWQHMQREAILHRWKRNGMRVDDLGFLADTDELFSRDFLRALQICDLEEFRPGQDCKGPKVIASGLVFESTPECTKPRYRLWHPDIMIGECIHLIGNSTLHKPPERTWFGKYASRKKTHGRKTDWGGYLGSVKDTKDENGRQMYPLWTATDFRSATGVAQSRHPRPVQTKDGTGPVSTGYHFHNFFESSREIRHKYSTYGEPVKGADKPIPLSMINADLRMAVACSHGWPHPKGHRDVGDYKAAIGNALGPIFFENEAIRRHRVEDVKRILAEDEAIYGAANVTCDKTGKVCRNVAEFPLLEPSVSTASYDADFIENYDRHEIHGGEIGFYYFERATPKIGNNTATNATESLVRLISSSSKLLSPLNEHQYKLLSDERVVPSEERQRCKRYGFEYEKGRTHRRRIFYGSTIADDSFFTLQTVATETYNLFHTVAFVESNTTHTRTKRTMKFAPDRSHSSVQSKNVLRLMFGPNTHVSVDYFVDSLTVPNTENIGDNMFYWQHTQRDAIMHRWKRNGMRHDDVGFLADTDELFSRDFLRALQICDIEEFRPGQDCKGPKILASGLTFESSPECVLPKFRLWHPDVMIGECIDQVGNATLHKPAERTWFGKYVFRKDNHGRRDDWSGYLNKTDTKDENGRQMYPLWTATDLRSATGGVQSRQPMPIRKTSQAQQGALPISTGYHFHNFFESSREIRYKYSTFGEPEEGAKKNRPLTLINNQLRMAVLCTHGWPQPKGHKEVADYASTLGDSTGPIFFENEDIRKGRVDRLKAILAEDEEIYGAANVTCDEKGKNCRHGQTFISSKN